MQPVHSMTFVILLAYLVHVVSCTPMPNEDEQQPALPSKIEGEAETRRTILEDLQSKVQYGRNKDVNMQSMFSKVNEMSPLNKFLGKELINIIMDQAREAFLELNISAQCKEDFSKTVIALLASETWALRSKLFHILLLIIYNMVKSTILSLSASTSNQIKLTYRKFIH